MSEYPDDNYEQVHGQIIDELRPEYEDWKELLPKHKDTHKREIIRSVMARLERRVKNL